MAMMNEEQRLNTMIDAVGEFEREWYRIHPDGKYVAEHWDEYQMEKREFIDEYMRNAEESWDEQIEMLEEEQHKNGFYVFQDMMEMYRYER